MEGKRKKSEVNDETGSRLFVDSLLHRNSASTRTRVQYVHTSFTRLLTSVEKMAMSLHPPTEAIFSSAEARDRPSGENDSESTLCECV